MSNRWHSGPLLVQRPFYPEGDVCHVYLLHPPSGMVGGDVLKIRATSAPGTGALLTTPAAAKIYRSNGQVARQSVELRINSGAILEWLPQETILFDGARFDSSLRVDLDAGATFIGWDIVNLGRLACGERFEKGSAKLKFEISRDKKLVLIERTRLEKGVVDAPSGMRGQNVVGMLIAGPAGKSELEAACKVLHRHRLAGATLIDSLLICRLLGEQARNVLAAFIGIWETIRPMLCGREACKPRIWAT